MCPWECLLHAFNVAITDFATESTLETNRSESKSCMRVRYCMGHTGACCQNILSGEDYSYYSLKAFSDIDLNPGVSLLRQTEDF